MVLVQFQTHQRFVRVKTLSDHFQSVIVNVIVHHVQMNQSPVFAQSLCDRLGSVMPSPIALQNQTLQHAILSRQVLSQRFTTLETDFVSGQIKHSEFIVLQQVLSDLVNAIAIQNMLLDRKFLQRPVGLEHFGVMDCILLANTV